MRERTLCVQIFVANPSMMSHEQKVQGQPAKYRNSVINMCIIHESPITKKLYGELEVDIYLY